MVSLEVRSVYYIKDFRCIPWFTHVVYRGRHFDPVQEPRRDKPPRIRYGSRGRTNHLHQYGSHGKTNRLRSSTGASHGPNRGATDRLWYSTEAVEGQNISTRVTCAPLAVSGTGVTFICKCKWCDVVEVQTSPDSSNQCGNRLII